MSKDYTLLYVHLIWCTWDRLPLLTPEIEERVYAAIIAKCQELKCVVVAINGAPDHVHLLVKMPPSLAVSELARQVKGASSHLVRNQLRPDAPFQWSGTYAAITVAPDGVDAVAEYIRNQKVRHAEKYLVLDWEPLDQLTTPLGTPKPRESGQG